MLSGEALNWKKSQSVMLCELLVNRQVSVTGAGRRATLLVSSLLFHLSESCLQAAAAVYKSVSGTQFSSLKFTLTPPLFLVLRAPWGHYSPLTPLILHYASNSLLVDWSSTADLQLCAY